MKSSPEPVGTASLLLAGGLCMLPFLLPYRNLFMAEWLAGALGLSAVAAALAERGARLAWTPVPARWLIAFALYLGAQALIGHPTYVQLPLLAALYVVFAALLVWLGAQLKASIGVERAATVLAACLLAGALGNAAAGAIQFYGRPALLEDVVAKLPYGAAAWGNLAQPNLYANYLAVGATALIYLWLRGSLRSAFAGTAGVLLACAGALSGSRASLLYIMWFGALGLLAGRVQMGADGRRLKFALYGLAAAMLAAAVAVPLLNGMLDLGAGANGALERLASTKKHDAIMVRWELWSMAWRIFAEAPLTGAGIGEFAGAAFSSALPSELAQFSNVLWISPHNLPLQLLAETGAPGAFLALAGLGAWWVQAGRRYLVAPEPALWWIIAAVGIESIHSMVEFPLWNAHFLGVTAVLAGLGTQPSMLSRVSSRWMRIAAAATCLALALAMAVTLRDYVRLNATRNIGTPLTLAGAADTARDMAVMRDLARGPLAPAAEYWMVLGTPLNRDRLDERLKMSGRAMRYLPSHAIVVRRLVFLAFDGRAEEARNLLSLALHSFPLQCQETVAILLQALDYDRAAIEPLLAQARNTKDCGRIRARGDTD